MANPNLGVTAIAACLALAVVLYRVGRSGSVAHKLALLLVAEAQFEGGISQKERALLNRLRDSLSISASDADTIEGELQMRFATIG